MNQNKPTRREKELYEALRTLQDKYIANQSTKNEFVRCVTPREIPWYWIRCKQAVKSYEEFYK